MSVITGLIIALIITSILLLIAAIISYEFGTLYDVEFSVEKHDEEKGTLIIKVYKKCGLVNKRRTTFLAAWTTSSWAEIREDGRMIRWLDYHWENRLDNFCRKQGIRRR